MFAFQPSARPFGQRPVLSAHLKEQATPVIAASARTIPIDPALSAMVPGGAFQRGTTTVLVGGQGSGATSLGIALMGHASSLGHWCGAVGLKDPGIAAMMELGLDVRRVVFVPHPRAMWADAVAELLDGVDLLFVCPPSRVPHGAARRLMARAKERKSVLLVRTNDTRQWPVPPEATIVLERSSWQGAGQGDGRLAARRVTVSGESRRGTRGGTHALWLPALSGAVTTVEQ